MRAIALFLLASLTFLWCVGCERDNAATAAQPADQAVRATAKPAALVSASSTAQPAAPAQADRPSLDAQPANTWVKRSPLPDAPPSPKMGYESSWGYDQRLGKMIRWGGHGVGGGGPQITETWVYDVNTSAWQYMHPNNNPPGNCCCRENVSCPMDGKFYRFSYPAFGHGWYWDRSRWLREDSVWTYDLAANTWKNMRPGKEPCLNVGRCAAWDPNNQVIWVYDTKLRVYDPYTNTWHSANQSEGIGKRSYGSMALDPRHNKLVLFGNQGGKDERTWVYDIAKDTWSDAKPKVHPPGVETSPTMVYDSASGKMVMICLSDSWRGAAPEKRSYQTWTYDVATNVWSNMNPPTEPDFSGSRNRLMHYLPDRNIVLLENCTKDEQQIWTYRLAEAKPAPAQLPSPAGLAIATETGGKATLTWQAVQADGAVQYRVYRAQGDTPWNLTFKPLGKPVSEPRLVDQNLKAGQIYHYYVVAQAGGKSSAPSQRVRTQPRLVLDSRVDVLAKDKVVYSWTRSADPDVAGYVVERAVVSPISAAQYVQYAKQYVDKKPLEAMVAKAAIGQFVRLTPKPIDATEFADSVNLTKKVDVGTPYWRPHFDPATSKGYDMTQPGCPTTIYAYRVRAVNMLGVESGPSPYQLTVANEVENLFGKEDTDGKVSLKWDPSPHRNIKGYYVFRLNGRGFQWDKNSQVVLLTPEPITDTTFVDPKSGSVERRYYVVVADAIDQQGLPSHGVWAYRRYRAHYDRWYPQDGWHQ